MSFNKIIKRAPNLDHKLIKNKNKISYVCIYNNENIGICLFDIDKINQEP